MKENDKKRDCWLDLTRVCAIFLVLLCHATENYYRPVLLGDKRIQLLPWLVENLLFTLGRLGVPLFLAISGTLLLGKTMNAKKFYKKSLLPLVLTTEIWIFLNYLFVCIFRGVTFNILELVKQLLFLKESSLSHMWYMPMIIGIYIVLPFLSRVINEHTDLSEFSLIYLGGIIVFVFFPTINAVGKEALPIIPALSSQLDKSFWGGVYGLYLFSGYFIARKRCLEKIKTRKICCMMLMAFILNSSVQFYLYYQQYYKTTKMYWYTSVAIFVMGLLLFELFRRTFSEKNLNCRTFLEILSKCSFGVYLVHKPCQVLMVKYLPLEGLNTLLKIAILCGGSFVISLLIVYLTWKSSKRAGRLLFFIK